MTYVRDTQRGKVYKSERVLDAHNTESMESLEDVERYCRKVLESVWVRKKFNHYADDIKLADGRGRRSACAFSARGSKTWRMAFPKWARKQWVVLHEISHCVTSYGVAAHGWQFAGNYLLLIRHYMGSEAHAALKASFKAHRVRFTEPRPKRVLTEEQKQVLRERVAKARAARDAMKADQ